MHTCVIHVNVHACMCTIMYMYMCMSYMYVYIMYVCVHRTPGVTRDRHNLVICVGKACYAILQ